MFRHLAISTLGILFWFIGIAVPFVGCSSDPVRYPEDSIRFKKIAEAVETLRAAYVEKDATTTHDLLLPLPSLEQWEQGVRQDFKTFSDITLNLSIERVTIDGDLITVYVHWQGEWRRASQGDRVSKRGHGILQWSGTQVILLTGVEGDLPFGMAARQALS